MRDLLIKMADGGLKDYLGDKYCPSYELLGKCLKEIDVTILLTKYEVKTKVCVNPEESWNMTRLLLIYYTTIKAMTEKEFVNWLKVKLLEISIDNKLETYSVVEIK